jgi:hypothetical protein
VAGRQDSRRPISDAHQALGTIDEPLGADLVVGLFELFTMERLPVTLEDQSVHDHVKLGRITIRPATTVAVPESAQLPGAIHFDTGLQLIGWQMDKVEGEGLCIDLWWQGADALRQDLTVFVHGYGVDDRRVAQADGPPRQGQFPTSLWKAQDIVRDRHCFSPPPEQDLSRIEIGLYDPVTLERLAAYDGDGKRLPNDAVSLEIHP